MNTLKEKEKMLTEFKTEIITEIITAMDDKQFLDAYNDYLVGIYATEYTVYKMDDVLEVLLDKGYSIDDLRTLSKDGDFRLNDNYFQFDDNGLVSYPRLNKFGGFNGREYYINELVENCDLAVLLENYVINY